MPSTIKGPAIFLAQFAGDAAPFNSFDSICKWAAGLGYKGVQIPTWDGRMIDLKKAAESKTYCDEVKGIAAKHGLTITELSTHLQGHLVVANPAFNDVLDAFAPKEIHGNPKGRAEWAKQQVKWGAAASKNMGLTSHVTFSGSLVWPYLYSWPPRPPGLIDEGFAELGKVWTPLLNAFDEAGVDVGFELHPGEDLMDGASFEMFLEKVNNHKRAQINYDPSHFVLQQLDYLQFIDIYHERICAFHVKDAEFNPTGKQGVYSGFQGWVNRAGRFRSLGDGQVDFGAIFSKLSQYGYDSWAVLEWECCLKSSDQGAAEGAPFIASHIIETTGKAFDDFAAGDDKASKALVKKMLGL
ncbi:sugar phosphate isomerase/epimerase family protein [Aestuariivirga litoralis]|uniref:sugar phosphate isomerase/epimerase family protein n=1 Tax=Aestuariivirga litoralis TaxID=2650924 RepID=UPI0018C6CF47|nr:sugar phosphate isomerase/epimerase [Aestuariivirga litoralis]MBG1232849.1 sugar phosphate isomerase/epimerase [Aestuariivirga litoralis]